MIDNAQDMTLELDKLPPTSLEQLERHITAVLYAIWRAQGKSKRVVDIRKDKDTAVWQGDNDG